MFKAKFAEVKTFTTAHKQSKSGKPEQSAAKIGAWHVDQMCPVLDWVVPDNFTACVGDNLDMWL